MSANTVSILHQVSDVPVKVEVERNDVPSCDKHQEVSGTFVLNSTQLSHLQARDVTISVSDPCSSVDNAKPQSISKNFNTQQKSKTKDNKIEPPPIDFSSVCGKFGWTTIGTIYLPFLMRGEDSFVAVRMVESKIISTYVDILPWTVFACTNIKSYYVTDMEAKLLNEINGFHCNFQFGYQTFSAKDVVVHLRDTVKFYEFLETCRTKLLSEGGKPQFKEQCGFVMVNCTALPYIRKGAKKYIVYNMISREGVSSLLSCTEKMSEWDMAFFRFLSSVASIDQKYLKTGTALCALQDLQHVLGIPEFQEWWPGLRYCPKSNRPLLTNNNNMSPKYGEPPPFLQPELSNHHGKCSQKLQDKMTNYQARSYSKAMQSNDSRAHLFPSSLEGLLSTSNHAMKFKLPYTGQMPSPSSRLISNTAAHESGLSSLATSKPTPFPPPPPLVRLDESPRSTTVPVINHCNMPNLQPPLYPYLHPGLASSEAAPWMAQVLEQSWMPEEKGNDDNSWPVLTSTYQNSCVNTSESAKHLTNRMQRECYDPCYTAFCRDDRMSTFQRGSPRPATGVAAPPHYPTPPQSSPLQPLSLFDCSSMPGLTEIYNMHSHAIGEICSPPPSPDTRTGLPTSPRDSYSASTSYQSHIVRLTQVESRYVLAINVEPYKHNSIFALPISDVVSKFLRGISVQSCQVVLDTVLKLHLFDCTRSHQETYAKHNVTVMPGSKLVSVDDIRNYLSQLKLLLAEHERHKDKNYSFRSDLQQPLTKRWCGNE